MAPSSKLNLKDKVEDGEMDLSLCEIQEVPAKEIATYKKVYSLDLSNNRIIQLPKSFCILTNLAKLDLSKNKIKSLPDNFGDLSRLKYLDLYKNDIQHLPLSFYNLKNLKWLDLKDNPLVPAIKEAAGDCLNTKQCHECASNIIYFFTKLKERVIQDKEERDKEQQTESLVVEKPKTQQDKKPKKKQKAKIVDEEIKPIVKPKLCKTDSKKSTKAERTHYLKTFSYIIMAQVFLVCVLFTLTSIRYERTLFIEEYLSKGYDIALSNSPDGLAEIGKQGMQHIQRFHESLGKYILQSHHEYVTYIAEKINSMSTYVSKFYEDK